MKKILVMIKYILLIAIILGLVFYIFVYKNNDSNENFQNTVNQTFSYFSANEDDYYTLSKAESPEAIEPDPDELILDIGGSFGELDASRMPWDSENKELSQQEALWGVVPVDATIALFKKIHLANQLDNINNLESDENDFYYQDPLFAFGTDNREVAESMTIFNQLLSYYMTAKGVQGAFGDLKDDLAKRASKGSKSKAIKPKTGNIFKKIRLNGVVAKAQGKIVRFLEKSPVGKGVIRAFKSFKTVGKGFGKIFKMLLKLKMIAKIALRIIKLILKKVVIGNIIKMIPPAPTGMILNFVYEAVITPVLMLFDGMITAAMDKWADSQGACPSGTTALDVLIPAPANMIIEIIPIIGDLFGFFYPYVCSDNKSGILVFKGQLNLPKYLEYPWLSCFFWDWPNYTGDYKSPVIQGKYLCTQIGKNNAGRCERLEKKAAPNPYDLYQTVYYWGDNTNNTSVMNLIPGYAIVSAIISSASGAPRYVYADNYYNFNRIIDTGPPYSELNHVNKKMKGLMPDYQTDYFLSSDSLPPNCKFFYADFSDPTMLVQMAQFYYNLSIANPVVDEDGFHNIQIISKINYVIASSLFTCDIECEMLNIKYNPRNGGSYNEFITFNHDRRFYYKVNYSNTAPYYWEDTSNRTWVTLDDRYDDAMYNLNEYLSRMNVFRYNEHVTGDVFIAAYEQIQNTGTMFSNLIASSNYTTEDYNMLQSNYRVSQENYSDLFDEITRRYPNSREFLDYRVSTVVGIKDELWELQKTLRPVTQASHPQYSLYGCTHLDDTAGAAAPPDISAYQDDSRKRVNFDVLPYLAKCRDKFINIDQCIDISNVEQIINKYKEKYPNIDIKSILNIKAQGSNVCQFTWNEVTTGQNDERNKTYNFLYQMDLSSCTFCLPNTLIAEGSSDLPVINSVKIYKNPITDSNERIYNPDYDTTLRYRKAFYFKPLITSSGPRSNVAFEKISDVDTIPRYDPNTYAQLPDLVRPKKPIRVSYPRSPQTNLFKGSNDVCSNPDTLTRFILDYNKTNPSNKILSIIRAFTSSSNSCDLEVDVLIKNSSNDNKVKRQTLSFNMKEGFENIYTYDSLKNTDGLNITKITPNLETPYSESGITFGRPYNNEFNPTVISNILFFNNDLVTNYTKNTIGIVKNTTDLLIDLKGAQFLGDDASNCAKKCDDREIMQRIMEQYNNDNQAKGRYDQENKTMYTIFKSATESADKCHLYFAQTTDNYGDLYAANKNNSSNYLTESRVALRAVNMKQLPGTCQFVPIVGQTYLDISASDVALQSGVDVFANDSNFYVPVRENCTNLNCRDINLISAAIDDYNNVTGSSVTRVFKTLKVTNDTCDYNIIQNLVYDGEVVPDIESILRVRYKYPIFDKDDPTNCAPFTYQPATVFNEETYKSDTFELQFSENIDDDNPEISPILSFMGNTNDPIRSVIQNIP